MIIFLFRGPRGLSALCTVNSIVNSLTSDVGSVYNSLTNEAASGWNGATSFLGSLGDGVYGTLTCKSGITGTR